MALSRSSPYTSSAIARYRQGDILRDVSVVEWAELVGDEIVASERNLSYCVVLSQECDLEHDFNNRADLTKSERDTDKFLPSILLCPAYPGDQLKLGTHLSDSGFKMRQIGKSEFSRIQQNQTARYHFLPEHADSQVPDLVIDFKHYITIPRSVAYRETVKQAWLTSLDDLFREHLSSRFAQYLSRIGLPELESFD